MQESPFFSPLLIQSYNPNAPIFRQTLIEKQLDTLIAALREETIPLGHFWPAVDGIIKVWGDKQALIVHSAKIKELVTALPSPPLKLLELAENRVSYFHLFVTCLYPSIDGSIKFFKNILKAMLQANFQVHIPEKKYLPAAKVAKIAVQCFALLTEETQTEINEILAYLNQQPEITFYEKSYERLKIYQLAAEIFINISFESIPPLASIPQKITLTESYCIEREWELIPTKAAAEIAPLKDVNEESSPYQELTQSTIFNKIETYCSKEVTKQHLAQFQAFQQFGTAFWENYGIAILKSILVTLKATLTKPRKKERLLELCWSLIPFLSLENKDPLEKKMIELMRKSSEAALLPCIENGFRSLIETIQTDSGSDLCRLILDTYTPLLFSSQTPSEKKMDFLLLGIQACAEFLNDLNKAYQRVCPSLTKGLTLPEEEQLLVIEMNYIMAQKGIELITPNDLDVEATDENLVKSLEKLLKLILEKNGQASRPELDLLLYFLANYLANTIDQLLSPETLHRMIEVALEATLSIEKKSTSEVQEKQTYLDPHDTEKMGQTFHALFMVGVQLGGYAHVMPIIQSFDSLIAKEMHQAAEKAHQSIKNFIETPDYNDLLFSPVLWMNKLLLEQKGPLKERPFELFQKVIDQQMSYPIRLALRCLPLEEMCQNVGTRLAYFSQQKSLLKMMLGYFIKKVSL